MDLSSWLLLGLQMRQNILCGNGLKEHFASLIDNRFAKIQETYRIDLSEQCMQNHHVRLLRKTGSMFIIILKNILCRFLQDFVNLKVTLLLVS